MGIPDSLKFSFEVLKFFYPKIKKYIWRCVLPENLKQNMAVVPLLEEHICFMYHVLHESIALKGMCLYLIDAWLEHGREHARGRVPFPGVYPHMHAATLGLKLVHWISGYWIPYDTRLPW